MIRWCEPSKRIENSR